MAIRRAELGDQHSIQSLLTQLDYTDTSNFLSQKLARMLEDSDETMLVYEHEGRVVGFLSLHFIPQIALQGDFARISYFCVDESARSLGVGRALEEYADGLARQRGCDRMEVHCHSRRVDAHRFYARQGFEESPKYFIKRL